MSKWVTVKVRQWSDVDPMKIYQEVFLLLYCSRWLLREGSLGAIHPSGPIWPRYQLKYDQDINFCLTMKKREKCLSGADDTSLEHNLLWSGRRLTDCLFAPPVSPSTFFSDEIFVWCNFCLMQYLLVCSTSLSLHFFLDAIIVWCTIWLEQYLSTSLRFPILNAIFVRVVWFRPMCSRERCLWIDGDCGRWMNRGLPGKYGKAVLVSQCLVLYLSISSTFSQVITG